MPEYAASRSAGRLLFVPVERATWRDTLLMEPRSNATVAVVADNPGQWMLHCHIPEHQEAGMMAIVSVG